MAVLRFPDCRDSLAPTSPRADQFAPGLKGVIAANDTCPKQMAEWLCQAATRIEFSSRSSGSAGPWPDGRGVPTAGICPLDLRAGLTVLCDGKAAGAAVAGYPISVEGGGTTIRRGDEIGSQLADVLVYGGSAPTISAVGCLTADASCATFAVALRTPRLYRVTYLVFQLVAGAEPAFVGAGLLTESAAEVLAGGTIQTVRGEMHFMPFRTPG